MRFFSFLRLTWMFFWRFAIFAALTGIVGKVPGAGQFVFFAPAVIAAVIVFIAGRTVASWPIFKLLRGNNFTVVFPYLDSRRGESVKLENLKNLKTIPSATTPGRLTGFEPRTLDGIEVYRSPYMFGVPGKGLTNAASTFGATAANLGKKGEENFARALVKADLLEKVGSAWSMFLPAKGRLMPNGQQTDIDCAIATDSTLWLVDLKNYRGGGVTYKSSGVTLHCIDDATGAMVGQSLKMSKNMEMAADAMRSNFPTLDIRPVVVFMPTDKGAGCIDNVYWPGRAEAMNLDDFLAKLEGETRSGLNPHAPTMVALQKAAHALVKS